VTDGLKSARMRRSELLGSLRSRRIAVGQKREPMMERQVAKKVSEKVSL
jgi:hypothetical protein